MSDEKSASSMSRDSKIAIIVLVLIIALVAGAFIGIAYLSERNRKREREEVMELKRWAAEKLAPAAAEAKREMQRRKVVSGQGAATKHNATNDNPNSKPD